MRIESEIKLGFKDVLIRPKRSTLRSRSMVDVERTFEFKHSPHTWKGVPIVASNMDRTGTFSMLKTMTAENMLVAVHKHYSLEAWKKFMDEHGNTYSNNLMVSCGTSDQDFKKLNTLFEEYPQLKFICIDVANGYSEYFVEYLKQVRNRHPEAVIVAGNVTTGEMVEELILSGADIVKVGIGPGSVCTTRVKTGVGYPQLSAIIECADAAHGLNGHIIGDGGCTCPGDIAKAIGAGADFVMLGGMLAGYNEGEGEIIEVNGKQYMEFYGMSSATAMNSYSGGVAEYRASEGKTVLIPYKGKATVILQEIMGGLRSACTYVGASKIKEMTKRTTFIRVAEQENTVFQSDVIDTTL